MNAIAKVGVLVATANASDTIRAMMRNWEKTVGFSFDATRINLHFSEGAASLHEEPHMQSDVSFVLTEATFDRLIAEELTPLAAKMRGLIQSSGNIIDILRFASILTAAIAESQKDFRS